ncbi:MAG: hypothetical protein EOM59_08805 [Clostridia bacterium]|nr:hypothetical protein [Clostridia bacterium]
MMLIKSAPQKVCDIINEYAIEKGLLKNKDELIYIPEILESQEKMISQIIYDIRHTPRVKCPDGVNPIYLGFKYIFAKAFEAAFLTEEFGYEAFLDNMNYSYKDLLEDKCGLALDSIRASMVDTIISIWMDGIFMKFQESSTIVFDQLSDDFSAFWDYCEEAMEAMNVLGMSIAIRNRVEQLDNES